MGHGVKMQLIVIFIIIIDEPVSHVSYDMLNLKNNNNYISKNKLFKNIQFWKYLIQIKR